MGTEEPGNDIGHVRPSIDLLQVAGDTLTCSPGFRREFEKISPLEIRRAGGLVDNGQEGSRSCRAQRFHKPDKWVVDILSIVDWIRYFAF